jgi:hypothetical protein
MFDPVTNVTTITNSRVQVTKIAKLGVTVTTCALFPTAVNYERKMFMISAAGLAERSL